MTTINLEFLSKFPLFHGVSTDDIEMIRSLIRVRDYRSGDLIISEDEFGEDLYLLLEGEIEITQKLMIANQGADDERNKSLATLKAEFHIAVGETSLYGEGKRTASVRALNNVVMGSINRFDFLQYCEKNPSFGFKVFFNLGGILSKRLGDANSNIKKLSTAFVLALERGR